MPRRPRLIVAGIPCHITQRGNNKNPIFLSTQDYFYFLKVVKEAKSKHPCLIYSYCLMPNHFHLLSEPKEKESISLFMKLLGGKYVLNMNKIHNRSGTLWQSRFKCSLIDSERYFLRCLRYIEMNPVRAGIVSSPELYPWSSYSFRAFGKKSDILDSDPWYESLGSTAAERQFAYRKFFQLSPPDSELELKLIRDMTNKNGIIGNEAFKESIEHSLGRQIIFRPQGRPAKIDPTP